MFFFPRKSHCKLPAALTQMHLPVGFHSTTAAFHLMWPSMNPFLVFQHYGPLKVLLSLSLDKLSNDWFTFPLPADGTEYTQWSPCQGCSVWAGYHSFRKVRTIQSHGESWVCQRDKDGANYGGARGSSAPLNETWDSWKRDLWIFGESQKNIDNVLFRRVISLLSNVIIVDYYVQHCNNKKIIHDGNLNLIHFNKDNYTCYFCHEF